MQKSQTFIFTLTNPRTQQRAAMPVWAESDVIALAALLADYGTGYTVDPTYRTHPAKFATCIDATAQ